MIFLISYPEGLDLQRWFSAASSLFLSKAYYPRVGHCETEVKYDTGEGIAKATSRGSWRVAVLRVAKVCYDVSVASSIGSTIAVCRDYAKSRA